MKPHQAVRRLPILETLLAPIRPDKADERLMVRYRSKRNRRWVLIPAGFTLLLILLAWLHPYAFRTTLSYATRPLWDRLEYPSSPIVNLATPTLFDSQPPATICRIHHSIPRTSDVQLWDAIIFSHELDMLEIHLAELYTLVNPSPYTLKRTKLDMEDLAIKSIMRLLSLLILLPSPSLLGILQ
jgi:hypothetical protein